MKFIGITGGVGAGKTEILKFLSSQSGIRVMLADEIAHEVMEPKTECNQKLQELFSGDNVFEADGSIMKNELAKVIFSDEEKRKALNEIVHPAVKQRAIEVSANEKEKGELRILVLEAALLIEEGYDKICDELWYIYTTEENRKKRLIVNRGYSEEKIENIFQSQLKEEEYRRYCKVVIDNNGDRQNAVDQVAEVINRREYQL